MDFLAFEVDVDANVVGTWLLYLSLAFSLWSAWVYIRDFFKAVYAADAEGAGGPEAGPAEGGKGLDTPEGRDPINPPLDTGFCGNSSAVEHRLAKARVEGSNPFSRSI